MEIKETLFQSQQGETRMNISDKLQTLLSNHMALYIKLLNCHWNVVDSRFQSLHALFEEQYTQLADQNDTIAERIRQLGSKVGASLSTFSSQTTIEEINKDLSGNEMIQTLIKSYEDHTASIREIIGLSEENNDPVTADLLTGILSALDKNLWMLKSHL